MESSKSIAKKIEAAEARLTAVRESQQKFQARAGELEVERKSLIVAARVNGDSDAKKRIESIDAECINIARELRDDGDAVGVCERELAELKNQLATAEFEEHRDRVAKAVKARAEVNYEGKMAKLIDEMATLACQWRVADINLVEEVRPFDSALANELSDANYKARELLYDLLAEAFRAGAMPWPWPGPVPPPGLAGGMYQRRRLSFVAIIDRIEAAQPSAVAGAVSS